jgi:SecY interacting protein Syd
MTSPNLGNVNLNVSKTVQQFAEQYVNNYQKIHGVLPQVKQDEQWPSPCEQNKVQNKALLDGNVFWQPANISNEQLSFDNVESALNVTLHEDIKSYFTSIYSESLEAQCDDGKLSLLFAWNEDDFQRLQENIIGHILMKQRLKQPITVFFAVTDEEDMIISFDNDSGAIWVERVGCKPHKKLTDSIVDFINMIEPVA